MASAQAPAELAGKPDQGFWLAADSAIDEGDEFLVPPDTEVGVPILWPPDGGYLLMGGGGTPSVQFIYPGGPGAGCPALCPLKKPPSYAGVCLHAEGGPGGGGCYNWLCSAETGCFATYTSTTCGLEETTKVSYTVWKETSDEVTSGFIRVFDADLTFQGGSTDPQDTVEDDPGFFMAKGTRKSLAISLSPADPDDVMPSSFDEDLHPRGLLPPYQVGVSQGGACCVDFYAAQDTGSPLTGSGLLWGWTEVEFEVFEETPTTPGQIYVQAETAGTCTVDLWLMFRCPQECGDWLAETDSAGDSVKLTVLGLKLKEVTFSADPDSPVNYFSVAADTDASTYPVPQWKDANGDGDADHPAEGDHKYPVCFIRNTKMAATVKVTLGSPEYFTGAVKIRGDGPGNLSFPATDAAVAGGEATTVTQIKCANAFPNSVMWYDPLEIKWEISRDGGVSWIEIPPHSKNDAFITLDTPQCATPFRTVLYLATKNGGTDADTCLTNTWAMFGTGSAPMNVKAWKDDAKAYDRPLYYYNGGTTNATAAEMLADQEHSNGQCSAWVSLLLECWKANNIPDLTPVCVNAPNTHSIEGFAVKEVGFGEAHYPGDAPWKYIAGDLNFAVTDLPGQNTNPPTLKSFGSHYMARRTNIGTYTYYDPSYGTVVSEATLDQARAKWRDNALDFWRRYTGYPEMRYSLLTDLPNDLPVFTNSW
jgi:hypothetical protein